MDHYGDIVENSMYTLKELDHKRVSRISSVSNIHKAQFAQYLTPIEIASFMAKITVKYFGLKDLVTILDPGAGLGILSCSLINELKKNNPEIHINLDAYEIDKSILDELKESYQIIKKYEDINYNISDKNFITDIGFDILWGINKQYDMIIMNPPYKKIKSNSEYRKILHDIDIETVNTYSAFMAIAIKLLSKNGILTAIVPRSFCNGLYFFKFRKLIYDNTSIQHIHIFESRMNNFKEENILQENIIITLRKTKIKSEKVTITYSKEKILNSFLEKEVPIDLVVDSNDKQYFISIPHFHQYSDDIPLMYSNQELGFDISTGPIVDFRMAEKLVYDTDGIPLLYPIHIRNQKITWPIISKKPNAIRFNEKERDKYCYKKGFYIVLKRFSSKEEKHRIQATLIAPDDLPSDYFTVENHLNIIHNHRDGLNKDLAFGLVAYLNSDYCDAIFRKFSGHTQVNATDLRNMKYPSLDILTGWSN
jgi:adenine-specific DNA-methyltransferase